MELVKVKDSRQADYENILIRRDALQKEGEQYLLEYIRLFGDLINDVFRMKIECIEKKKKISWCQSRINKGMEINAHDLEQYINSVMSEYYEQLEDMIASSKAAREGKVVSQSDLMKIKEIYRYLAKMIHPDVRPDLADDGVIKELWVQIVSAYRFNRLEDLEELKFKTESYLVQLGNEDIEIEIPDIEEKIRKVQEEIAQIMDSLPYQYHLILDTETAKNERRKELQAEMDNYSDYSKQLDEVLKNFRIVRYTA